MPRTCVCACVTEDNFKYPTLGTLCVFEIGSLTGLGFTVRLAGQWPQGFSYLYLPSAGIAAVNIIISFLIFCMDSGDHA